MFGLCLVSLPMSPQSPSLSADLNSNLSSWHQETSPALRPDTPPDKDETSSGFNNWCTFTDTKFVEKLYTFKNHTIMFIYISITYPTYSYVFSPACASELPHLNHLGTWVEAVPWRRLGMIVYKCSYKCLQISELSTIDKCQWISDDKWWEVSNLSISLQQIH